LNITYTIVPQLDKGETTYPTSAPVALDLTKRDVWSATFIVKGAMGYITGRMSLGSLSGPPVETGVLVYATTATLTGAMPPAINEAVRTGSIHHYAGLSGKDGSFRIAVRGGGSAYNLYAWCTIMQNGVPTVLPKQQILGIPVNPGDAVVENFYW